MDTISRENNSYLPVAGVLVGVIALVLSVVALAKVSSAKKELSAQIDPISAKIDEAESQARTAAAAADKASGSINKLAGDTQAAFTQVAQELGNIRGEITKVQEAKVAKAPAKGDKAAAGPVVAGPDEYIVKGGDTGYKIASGHGVSVADLQAVNPGVSWTALKVGQKVKLPAKK
ncbi:MAG: LysM peptidoglycan-binding domain-containing protein [Opitutaceae bacterium]|jgi:LysM repeat protein